MIDTHTHLYDKEFDPDFEETLQRAKDAGVTRFIFPAIDSSTYERMLQKADQAGDCVSIATGLHPTSVDAGWKKELAFVEKSLSERKWCAIGEIGIDGHWSREFIEEQQTVLEKQMIWASELDLPVIIHLRESQDAFFTVIERLSEKGIRMKGVMHAFSGSIETYHRIRQHGDFRIGIGGVLTYKKASIADTVKEIPLTDLLLETDSPYLSPVPYRGKRNESSYICEVAEKLAELKGCSVEEIDSVTTENAMQTFNLK